MNKIDRFDGLYNYLAYPIYDISEVLKKGVPINTKKLYVFMNTIACDEDRMRKALENSNYKNYNSRYVCILKIPSYYFGFKIIEGEYTPCIPLIRTTFDYLNGEKCYIIPNLILGIYDTETKQFIENSNYNSLFDPIGLQFADEQISRMREMDIPGIANYALARRNIPYEILLEQDQKSRVLESSIGYYISHAYRKVRTK